MKKTIYVVVLLIIINYSCNNSNTNSSESNESEVKSEASITDISGKYKMPENTCGFELIVTNENGNYSYNIKGKDGIVDIYGKLTLSDESGATYVNFILPEMFPTKTTQGLLENNTITIQNYGNADNQFTLFEDCEDKYMEFIKN
jgi:hypothetical protein